MSIDTPTDPFPDTPVLPEMPSAPAIAGFWRRVLAFLLDALILALLGLSFGWAFSDTLSRMGGYERLIGFLIALAYAGLLNSRLGGGQTVGKRLLGIRVACVDGGLLSVPWSLLRQAAFALPLFLNGAPFGDAVLMSPIGAVLSVLIFGGFFAIPYLFIFNRKTRRSLHDLVAGSCVVRTGTGLAPLPVAPLWRGHVIVLTVVAVLAAVLPLLGRYLVSTELFAGIVPVQTAMSAEPGVLSASVFDGTTYRSGGKQTTYISIQLRLDSFDGVDEARARKLARRVLEVNPDAENRDYIAITFICGYDMVIASSWRSQGYRVAPEQLE